MLSGLRGLAQSFVRGAVRVGMAVQETYWRAKELGIGYLEGELYTDYDKFAQQDFIRTEVTRLDQDHLIPGSLHEKSVWSLSRKFRYEVETPWTLPDGSKDSTFTTIVSNERLTPNEVFDSAVDHPSIYQPEEGAEAGEMEIAGVWST